MTLLEIASILHHCKFPGMTFNSKSEGNKTYLQVSFSAYNPETGLQEQWKGRKWLLSEHMTESEVVQTAFKAVVTALEHEAREYFQYKDRAVFGPHIDVNALWGIADKISRRVENGR